MVGELGDVLVRVLLLIFLFFDFYLVVAVLVLVVAGCWLLVAGAVAGLQTEKTQDRPPDRKLGRITKDEKEYNR